MQTEQGSDSPRADLSAAPGAASSPGVVLRAAATDRTVRVAAAVASGVAESLNLGLEAAASLNAIAVEGSRNVVAHAYPRGHVGPIWMRIEPPLPDATEGREVTISFRDSGRGCSFWPTSDDPPGIGLSLICELSERTQITSRRGSGMGMEASVAVSEDFDPATPLPSGDAQPNESELHFEGPALIEPVLPRFLGAHLEGPDATVDQIVDASRLGQAIATGLSDWDGDAPSIRVPDRPEGEDSPLLIRVGPIAPPVAERLTDDLGSSWDGRPGSLALTTEIDDGDRALACIALDIARD